MILSDTENEELCAEAVPGDHCSGIMKHVIRIALLLIGTTRCLAQVLSNNGAEINIPAPSVLSGGSINNAAGIITNTGTVSINSLTLQSGSTFNCNGLIQISGTVTTGGTFKVGNGTMEFNGSFAQSIPAAFCDSNKVKNLITNNSAGVTLNGTLNVTDILKASSGNFSTGTYLTLISSQTQTALIDGAGAGQVLGDVTMQRYLPAGFGYKYLASPFTAARVSQLCDDINLNDTFPRLWRYDENLLSAGWARYIDTSGLLNPLEGYAVNFGSLVSPKTVDITGTVSNGIMSTSLYNHGRTYTLGFNLIGNPYPSPIDWTASIGWTKTNIDNAVYYFNAGSTDQYLGAYSSYVNGVSSDGIASNIIPSMQGFFVHVSNGSYPVSATLGLNNNVRTNNLAAAFHKRTSGPDYPLIRFSAGYGNDSTYSDPLVIYLDDDAGETFNAMLDAHKMLNTDGRVPSLFSVLKSEKLSITAIQDPGDATKVIPLCLKLEQDGLIVFSARNIEQMPPGLHVYFADAHTGFIQDLEHVPTYQEQLNAGTYENRFFLLCSRKEKVTIPGREELNAYVAGDKIFVELTEAKGMLQISNTLGQIVHTEELLGIGMHEVRLPAAAPGIYILSLSTISSRHSRKVSLAGQ